jgi:CubicO group peptidase (beta-lactamase class C family)
MSDFAVNGKERVTTRQLLSHTAGMDLVSNTTEGLPTSLSAREHIEVALSASLSRLPGLWFEYNSPGFWVLAELVSRLSGTVYTDDLRMNVLRPLQMNATDYETQEKSPDRYVPAHATQRTHLAEQVRRLAYPAGGLIATAGDVLRFARCFLSGGKAEGVRLLSEPALAAMARPAVDAIYMGRPTSWGLGWQLGGPGDLRDPLTLFHWGASGTALWVDGANELAVVLLTATWFLDWRVYAEIVNGVYGSLAG